MGKMDEQSSELMRKEIQYVAWVDSATTHGWIASKDTDNVCGIGHVCTVGFLVRENDAEIVLALNGATDSHTSPHGDCIAIPKVCITTRQTLSVWPSPSDYAECARQACVVTGMSAPDRDWLSIYNREINRSLLHKTASTEQA